MPTPRQKKRSCIAQLVMLVGISFLYPHTAAGETNVAVFNFQMKSDTPDWIWLEKFLADQITTDFSRHRGALAVVARDKMQAMAQQLSWVPEMATANAKVSGQIKNSLRIKYLVSGVCTVSGDQLEIVGQIVHMDTRKELFRKVIVGRTDEVLTLQKQLSAELLSELTGKSSKQVLADLPVWTRSIPAVRALYHGMDLYDHGRYPEAWLEFRGAAREDPGYIEAQYWTGKMYYFMDRYEHARRSYEKFVYLDDFHPRMSDALLEYAHTYEKAQAPPEALLKLYESYGRRWPDVNMNPRSSGRPELAEVWSLQRRVRLLSNLGRYEQAARTSLLKPEMYFWDRDVLCLDNVMLHHQKTGRALGIGQSEWTGVLGDSSHHSSFSGLIQFTAGQSEQRVALQHRIVGEELARRIWLEGEHHDDDNHRDTEDDLVLVAPEGHVFKALRFYALGDGQEATISVSIAPWDMTQTQRLWTNGPLLACPITKPIADARKEGIRIGSLPPSGMLWTHVKVQANDENSSRSNISGMRIVAEFEKLGAHGSIYVGCVDTPYFRVDVDGIYGRSYTGLLGPLKAGKHTVTFRPKRNVSINHYPGTVFERSYDTWTTTVTVEPGKITKLLGRLPWKKGSLWSFWDRDIVLGRNYEGYNIIKPSINWKTCIVADDKTVRAVWTHQGDIWAATSTDGRTFSQPRRLSLPVSSGWDERALACIKDESGRYVLAFSSYRDGQRSRLYTCWSRDFEHWSRPSVVESGGGLWLYDNMGRFVTLANRYEGRYRFCDVMVSRDALRWEKVGSTPIFDHFSAWPKALIQRDDGRYEVIGTVELPPDMAPVNRAGTQYQAYRPHAERVTVIYRFLSGDLANWDAAHVGQLEGMARSLHAVHIEGRTKILAGVRLKIPYQYEQMSRQVFLAEDDRGQWRRSVLFPSLPVEGLSYHPGWGYYLAWSAPSSPWKTLGEIGPSLVGAEDLKPWEANSLPLAPATEPLPILASLPEPNTPRKPRKPKKPAMPPLTSPLIGKLAYVARAEGSIKYKGFNTAVSNKGEALNHKFIRLSSPEGLTPPAKNAGTVWPEALVATIKVGRFRFKAAVDADDANATKATLVRWNLTGAESFKDSVPFKFSITQSSTGPGNRLIQASSHSRGQILRIPLKGSGTMPVRIDTSYRTDGSGDMLSVRFMVCMEGYCRFGDKVHRVRVYDGTNNLRCDDVAVPVVESGRTVEIGPGDSVTIDVGDGDFKNVVQSFYGHPVHVDGKLWDLRASQDALTVSATLFDGPIGSVRLDHRSWKAWFVGKKWVMLCGGGAGPLQLPPDSYVVRRYQEFHTLEPGARGSGLTIALQEGTLGASRGLMAEVAADKQLDLAVGTPLVGRLTARQVGRKVRFSLEYLDASGRKLSCLYGLGHGTPVVKIRTAQGENVGRALLRGGSMCSIFSGTWDIPDGVKGTLTAEPTYPIQGPEPRLVKTTISVE